MNRTLTFVGLLLMAAAVSAEEDKLLPLRYNNPGLVVDLGVGLWSYPLPLDYDGDGDMDLLVSSMDKPTRGLYLFENPTQDPRNPLPVFKPGVRIAQGHHYMTLSEVDGEPVVLIPGREFRRDPQTGRFDFNAGTAIEVNKPGSGMGAGRIRANMWRYVDYDGDGLHDLVIGTGDWGDLGWDHAYDSQGRWRNGPLHGHVTVVLNSGTEKEPNFSAAPFRVQAGGGDVDVYGWPSPNFADFDGDGDLDLLCGEFLDGFTYFANIGTRTEPVYAAGQKLIAADGKPLVMHVQMITPTAVDWDNDGDLDLIVGDEDGRVAFVENTGRLRNGAPVFEQPRYFQQHADTLKFGALATPFACDWDQDGDTDILCGNTAGSIGWFENLGTGEDGLPRWNAPQLLNVRNNDGSIEPFRIMAGPNGSIQGPCEAKWGYTTFSVADWNGDGQPDIVYNSIFGRLGLLLRDGETLVRQPLETGIQELPPRWNWQQWPSNATLTQWRTTPLAVDFDQDGTLDLVLLDQAGFLTLRREGKSAERIFVDEQNQPLRLAAGSCGRSGRSKLALVDWDGDGRLDLLVNSENAAWYRNCEDRNGKIVLKRVGNLARRNVSGHTSSPTVCDFNGDGQPDLLVGSENGRIYHIAHEDCIPYTSEQLQARSATAPQPSRIPGLIAEEFIYDKAPFAQCHASTLCESSRGLVAAWFGGSKEGQPDVGIWTSYHDGVNWSAPLQVADGVQHDGRRYPCWNPVLFQPPGDAPTLLFFKVGPSPRAWWGEVMISYDRGRTFRERRRLPEQIDGPVRCKPILLSDGKTLLCGSSTEHDGWRVHFEAVSLINGHLGDDWRRIGPIHEASQFNAIQPTFLHHEKGLLQVLCRTKEGVISTSVSADLGQTWSEMVATDLPNPNSGIESLTLADGRHLLVYNPTGTGRTEWGRRSTLSIALSADGMSWKRVVDLEAEPSGEFSYPAAIQTADGQVHISYTWKRTRIKHLTLDAKETK